MSVFSLNFPFWWWIYEQGCLKCIPKAISKEKKVLNSPPQLVWIVLMEWELEVIGLTGYSKANWACDADDRKSIGAYCI